MIKGLKPRLLEVGKIKIGGRGAKTKTQGGKDYNPPVKYKSFMVTTTERGQENLLPDTETMKALGEKPTSIEISFPFDDIDMNFHTAYQYYKDGLMFCKGDGEQAEREGKPFACKGGDCPEFVAKNQCKVSGIMSCHIDASPHIDGIYRFRTHGWNSVTGILAALIRYQKEAGGILQGLPFKLIFISKSTRKGNVPAVTVESGVKIADFRELAIKEKRARLELDINIKEVEKEAKIGGFLDSIEMDDQGEIQEEFYPENHEDIPEEAPPPEKPAPGATSEELTDKMKAGKPPVKPDPKTAERDAETLL